MQLRQVFLWSAIVTAGTPVAFGQTLAGALIPAGSIPSGCHAISGLFPVGAHTAQLWEYDSYAMVMPPYKKKKAQSFQCGADKGTLYFFDYASASHKDRALLFAAPVLAKENGGHPLPVHEWSTGFVVVSFKNPPSALLDALQARLSPPSTASRPVELSQTLGRSNNNGFALPGAHESAETKKPSPPLPAPVTPKPVLPAPVVQTPLVSSRSVVEEKPAPDGIIAPKPAIVSHPFEPSNGEKPITAPPSPPPPAPIVHMQEPPKPPAPHPHPHPVVVVHKPVVPMSPAASAPVSAADLSSSLLESFASKMGCESLDRNAQTQRVCGFMQEFASGLPPELPFKEETLIGPVYVIDVSGRFTELHYDAFTGSAAANIVSLFTLPSEGGKDDFEIKQLVDARKAKTPLPKNDTAAKLPALEATKRMALRKSNARSVILQPTPSRKLFIRRAGDHLIIIGVSGETPAAQQNGSLEVCVLY